MVETTVRFLVDFRERERLKMEAVLEKMSLGELLYLVMFSTS